MLSDLSELEGRAWYARTLAAADSLYGLGASRSWADLPVSADSVAARRRVAVYLRRLAQGVRSGRVRVRDYRRLRAFLMGSLDAAGIGSRGAAPGGPGGSGGSGGVTPGAVAGAASSIVVDSSKATNTSNSATSTAFIGGES